MTENTTQTRDEIIQTYVEKLAALDQEIVSEHEERKKLQRDYESSKARDECMFVPQFDDLCSTDSECSIELAEPSQLALQLVEEGACNPEEEYMDQPGSLQQFYPYAHADGTSEVGTVDSHDRLAMNMMNVAIPFCAPTAAAVVPTVYCVPTMAPEVLLVPQTFETYQPYTGPISEYSESVYSLGPAFLARQSIQPLEYAAVQNVYSEPYYAECIEPYYPEGGESYYMELPEPYLHEVEREFTEAEMLERARQDMIEVLQTKLTPQKNVIQDKKFKKGQYVEFFWNKKWHNGKIIKYRKKGYVVRSRKHQKNIHRFSEMIREPTS